MSRIALVTSVALVLLVPAVHAGVDAGLKKGTPDVKGAGPLAFGPDGILFIGDTQSAAVFAVATNDTRSGPAASKVEVKNLNQQLAGLLGVEPRDVQINDLAVNPASGNVYLAVSRGRGPDAQPAIFRVGSNGKVSQFELKDVPFARAELPNAPDPEATGRRNERLRTQSITDLAYVDGRVFVAGLSNEEFASNLRSIPFPFSKVDEGTSVEIYHGAHGAFETRSPVRTFVPYDITGETHLVAAYTCTPLVKFPVADLKPGSKVKGTTIAELGNRNQPLDIVVYQKGGQDYLLIANNSRGIMKLSTDGIEDAESIEEPVRGGGTAGLKYQTIDEWQGVVQLDKLNDEYAVVLIDDREGGLHLQTVPLP
ncbi:MAG TPA: hypothetical protein VML55_15530 [Planctomycetaceae bacterium]|nr:hypothetical protein [Planctomycetaceae bacterium]